MKQYLYNRNNQKWLFAMVVFFFLVFQGNVHAQDAVEDAVRAAIAKSYVEDFEIDAQNGDVVIDGEVNSLYDKYEIFKIAAKVPGVMTIRNDLLVNTELVPDEIIEDNIRDEMKYVSSILEPDRINIEVNDKIVYLSGVVSYYREKVMMQTLVSWQKGVEGMVNNIEILPPEKALSDTNLKTVLNQIMKYEFPLEDNVEFVIDDGDVTLYGEARNLWAKTNIQDAFLDVIGILQVDNKLTVDPNA